MPLSGLVRHILVVCKCCLPGSWGGAHVEREGFPRKMSASALAETPASCGSSAPRTGILDLRARQRAVVPAYGRRQVTSSSSTELLNDAATLIAETLQSPLYGYLESAS